MERKRRSNISHFWSEKAVSLSVSAALQNSCWLDTTPHYVTTACATTPDHVGGGRGERNLGRRRRDDVSCVSWDVFFCGWISSSVSLLLEGNAEAPNGKKITVIPTFIEP